MDEPTLGLHGAFLRRDAIAALGHHRVRRRIETGEWRSLWPGVLIESTRAADPLTLASAAVQFGGDNTLVAGATAAYLHDCAAATPTPVHVIVPYEHWLRSRPGLKVHNGPLPDEDRMTVAGLPILVLERTLADVLCTTRPPEDALAVIDEALRMIEPARRERFRATIARRLAERRDPRGTQCGARLLGLATGRAESPAESWLLWRIVDSGYPPPEVNWSVTGPDGREVYRLDLAWPELRIALEYNGYAAHSGRYAQDQARREDLRRRGWIVVDVTASDLGGMGRVEHELDDAFRRRGVDMSRRTFGVLRQPRRRGRRAS